ncbi:NAD-dependent succinate-semialdehyde dehydrogenase [Alteribacillus iranensis]|uniref:Succinate semialdehyde dehydrogenase n=1 Tax=Alteribacillus iranensis TaxID=930128 RepID=A0A1I2B322_9BACI|nr:NAD-dependent succinate-semialdehyde dehydrogenase [Alteribacillus iranensis]SFE50565.1 succinate semialdehyde dehydrogenase [Alteribacillus iranensis]
MLYINGEWTEGINKEKMEVINPATGELVQETARASEEDTEQAIEAASAAFPAWKKTPAKERGAYILKAANIMRERLDEIAETLTKEMGKPLNEAKGEVNQSIEYFEWFAEEGKRLYGEIIPASVNSKRLMVVKDPVGVVAAITPWNFPAAMIARKVAPALAAGCPIIVKPASATPLSAMKIVDAFHEAGLPKGVLNLVIGSASKTAGPMMKSPEVRKVTFTGSTEVGKVLIEQSAATVKKMSMELGGHAPFIVFEDADLDKAAEAVVGSKFRNAGQTCICTNRVYVQESVKDAFIEKFAAKVSDLKIGNGLEEGVEIGPLIEPSALDKVEEHIQDAVQKGGKIETGGNRVAGQKSDQFFEPTVISNANDEMLITTEETFGPVAPVYTFKTEEEAIKRANHKEYGLAAYCFTNDLSRSHRIMDDLEYGIVGINDPIPTTVQAPFGGVKESGMGREGGRQGIEEFVEDKYVSIGNI